MPDLGGGDDLPTAHPRDVAATVNAQVAEIEKGLALNRSFERKKDQVSPGPCGKAGGRRHVKGWGDRNPNPNQDSWYVSFSPYSIMVITWMDVPKSVDTGSAINRLRGHLQRTGWQIVSFIPGTGGKWELKAESPQKGYGGIVDSSTTVVNGQLRIGVTFSSPCFRHPDELAK